MDYTGGWQVILLGLPFRDSGLFLDITLPPAFTPPYPHGAHALLNNIGVLK